MKITIVILIMSCFLLSCATIMNQPYKNIAVSVTKPSRIVVNKDTVQTVDNKARIVVQRSKEPIILIAITDSLKKEVNIDSKNSGAYYINIFYNYGLGMLIDQHNPKRYTYPDRIYLNSSDTLNEFFKYGQDNRKGEVYLHLSLPYINQFRLKPDNESVRSNMGFWGVSAGLDYYHSKNRYLNFSASAVTDFFLPVPAAVDLSGEYELMTSSYFSLSENYQIKRFSVGYGLSYTRNNWNLSYSSWGDAPPPTREPVSKSNNSIGLLFSTYFQTLHNFYIGLIYRPTFIRLHTTNPIQYEHLISIDLAWKIRLIKKSSR